MDPREAQRGVRVKIIDRKYKGCTGYICDRRESGFGRVFVEIHLDARSSTRVTKRPEDLTKL